MAASGGGGAVDPFVLRLVTLCDAACESIREAPGCPDLGDSCSLTCTNDRIAALEIGCSFEPALDCADAHPETVKSFCVDNTIKPVDAACDEVLAEYNACVLAASG